MNIKNIITQKLDEETKHTVYVDRYINFIESCRIKNDKDKPKPVELHHVLPKSEGYFPEYKNVRKYKWNGVHLTYRQHLVAHMMLAKLFGGKMWYALWAMVNGKGKKYRKSIRIDTKLVASIREHVSKEHRKYMTDEFWTDERREYFSEKFTGSGNPFYGKQHPKEVLERIKQKNTGRTVSSETRGKISESLKGRIFSDETIKKLSESKMGENNPFYGKSHSKETLDKMSKANTGRPNANKGKKLSDEWVKNISESQKGKVLSESHKRKIGDKHRGKAVSDETKKKLSESKKGIPSKKKGIPDKKIECPHCSKLGGSSVMKRWHFDNCKHKQRNGG